jgi:hypothetical protein
MMSNYYYNATKIFLMKKGQPVKVGTTAAKTGPKSGWVLQAGPCRVLK